MYDVIIIGGGPTGSYVAYKLAGMGYDVVVLEQKETPGLGAKIDSSGFRSQFAGLPIGDTRWAVKKDQGDIDAITAATISSRAVTEAVKEGLDIYMTNRNKIAEEK